MSTSKYSGSAQTLSRLSFEDQSIGEQDQVFDFFRTQRGVDGAERPAHAVAQQVDGIAAGPFAGVIDRIIHIVKNIVLNAEKPVAVRGDAPIDVVGVEPVIDEMLHDALAGAQVENVGTVYQRERDEERRLVRLLGVGFVLEKLKLVLTVDRACRRRAHAHFFGHARYIRHRGHLAHESLPFIRHGLSGHRAPGGCGLCCRHRPLLPLRFAVDRVVPFFGSASAGGCSNRSIRSARLSSLPTMRCSMARMTRTMLSTSELEGI